MNATIADWLAEGPFTLTLSAGFFGFYAHAGFVAALHEAGLRPARLSGASAGALVAGLVASGRTGPELRDRFLAVRRADFWDPKPGLGLLRGDRFRQILDDFLGHATFEACPTPVAVTAFDLLARRPRVLDSGLLAPAIQASCAFPGLLQPVRVHGRLHLDGALSDRPGLLGVPPGERVLYHHLPSSRRRFGVGQDHPRRPSLVAIEHDGLPQVHPFALDRGGEAFTVALRETRRALARPK